MANVDDIDTISAVEKYLSRDTVVSRTQEGADQGEEISAILEAVAISFLLSPQTVLTLVLMAKNQLQQIAAKDLELIDFISKAIEDVDNPDTQVSDLSDLTEASTALVEIDRLGSFASATKAFERYNGAINRFLDQQLAKSLKRRRRGEFERSGFEARQDLSTGLSLFNSTHAVLIEVLNDLANVIANFRSVDLTKIVSQKTVSRVRTSLQNVQRGFQQNNISKTSAAIELLAGAASLQSISSERDVFDATLETGVFPVGRDITVGSEPTSAFIITELNSYSITGLPVAGFSIALDEIVDEWDGFFGYFVDKPYLRGNNFDTNINLTFPPGALKLYLDVQGAGTPAVEFDLSVFGGGASVSAVQTALNAALNPDVQVFINGTADGKTAFALVGGPGITQITVKEGAPPDVDGFGTITPADPSGHAFLFLVANSVSVPGNSVSRDAFLRDLHEQLDARLLSTPIDEPGGGPAGIRLESRTTGPGSSIRIISTTPTSFGFDYVLHTAEPKALLLTEKGQPLDPRSVGVFVGSRISMTDDFDGKRSGAFTVTGFDGNRILCDGLLPRGRNKPVKVLAPAVASVQDLLRQITPFISAFDDDSRNIQRVVAPLLSKQPTPAQIADAKKVIAAVRSRLTNTGNTGLLDILGAIIVRDDQSDFALLAKSILSSLEERGLDNATDLLTSGKFAEFFALGTESASKSGSFLHAVETVMTDSLQTTTLESEMEDIRPSGEIPDDTLAAVEPSTESR